MKLDKLVGERFKERPAEYTSDSLALLVRGGYLKSMEGGIHASCLPLKRIARKIQQIIREEMDAIQGQEVQFPSAMPAREAAVQLVQDYAVSYAKYPFMIYQIQTSLRNHTLMEAFSFHTSREDLEAYCQHCHSAYERICSRIGLPQVIPEFSCKAGMDHDLCREFVLPAPTGEDSLVICPDCGYRSGLETAVSVTINEREALSQPLDLVHTPEVHTIEDLCHFFHTTADKCCKAVVYQKDVDDSLVVVFIRGDLALNETKLTGYLGSTVHPALLTQESGLNAGFIGPCHLPEGCTILFDASLKNTNNLYCGGNQTDYHYSGLDLSRDVGEITYHDFAQVTEGGICPCCGRHSLTGSRGIKVGTLCQPDTNYTERMQMTYLDKEGGSHHPHMGCYSIDINRLITAICEAHHDEYGPTWPMSIAPWQVHICAIRADNEEVRACADSLYSQLQAAGVEVLCDDRNVSAGVMFSDADLLGVPLRITVSPRNLKEGCCEVTSRDKSISMKVSVAEVKEKVQELI